MADGKRIWNWEDEKRFIMKLGKPNLSDKRTMKDRYWSTKPRLELLEQYLYVCTHLRTEWRTPLSREKVLAFILEQLDQELTKDRRKRRKLSANLRVPMQALPATV